jgi:hypothetical protein
MTCRVFVPWRIDVDYLPVQIAPIKPLIAQLDFIADKTHWGAAFRFGQVGIGEVDFRRIASAMGLEGCAEQKTDQLGNQNSDGQSLAQSALF